MCVDVLIPVQLSQYFSNVIYMYVLVVGLLVVSALQAFGGSQGAGSASCWASKKATSRESDPRQVTHICTLYKLYQVGLIVCLFKVLTECLKNISDFKINP